MTVHAELDSTNLTIRLTGLDAMLALKRSLVVPVASIREARVITQSEAKGELGWRIGGGYLPGSFAAGWFTMPGHKGSRQWWSVYRDPEVLMIDTTQDRPARVVLQIDDRLTLADALQARITRS